MPADDKPTQGPHVEVYPDGVSPDAEAEQVAGTFKPNMKPAIFTVAANVLLGVVCLGIPYWLGNHAAQRSLAAFSPFAQCLLGGEPGTAGGLALPPGDMDHFASNYIHEAAAWPASCNDRLQRIAPEEALFMWPSVKQASVDVRAVVGLMHKELDKTTAGRASGASRVPTRPILALSKLRAGLTIMAQAAGADEGLSDNAVSFPRPPRSPRPSLLPIYSAEGSSLDVRARSGVLEAVALDRRGISWLRVDGHVVDRQRIKRPGLVQGMIRASDDSLHAVWAMPAKGCEEKEDRCVNRATGISPFEAGAQDLAKPVWLAGHPAGRVDRVVAMPAPGHVHMITRADAAGRIKFKSFELPAIALEKAPPLSARVEVAQLAVEPALDATLLGDHLLYAVQRGGAVVGHVQPVGAAPQRPIDDDSGEGPSQPVARPLPPLPGKDAWVSACGRDWFVVGTDHGLLMGQLAWPEPARVNLRCSDAIHLDDAGRDGVRLSCSNDAATLLCRQGQALTRVHCKAGTCAEPGTIAEGVRWFDAVDTAGGAFVAFSGDWEHAQIRVQPADAKARPGSPAGCWDPRGGLCGVPTLFADGKRLLLGAREGNDLLVVESLDGARTWQPLTGLKTDVVLPADPNAVIEQHKIRKGLQ